MNRPWLNCARPLMRPALLIGALMLAGCGTTTAMSGLPPPRPDPALACGSTLVPFYWAPTDDPRSIKQAKENNARYKVICLGKDP